MIGRSNPRAATGQTASRGPRSFCSAVLHRKTGVGSGLWGLDDAPREGQDIRNHGLTPGYRTTPTTADPLRIHMDCRSFRRNHLAYLDDTLPGVQMAEMRDHMQDCRRCARQDVAVRRSLLLLRNVPTVQVSRDFNDRLQQRLLTESARGPRNAATFRGPSFAFFAGTAASVVTLGSLGVMLLGSPSSAQADYPRLPAVVAYPTVVVDGPSESVSMPAFVASMSTGMPVWPALLLADEGSVRFATAELDATTWSPARPQD